MIIVSGRWVLEADDEASTNSSRRLDCVAGRCRRKSSLIALDETHSRDGMCADTRSRNSDSTALEPEFRS